MPVMISNLRVHGPALLIGWQTVDYFQQYVPNDAKALLGFIYHSSAQPFGSKPVGAGDDWNITRTAYVSQLLIPAIMPAENGVIHVYHTTSTYIYVYGYLEDHEIEFLDTPYSLGAAGAETYPSKIDLSGADLPMDTTGIIATTQLSPYMGTVDEISDWRDTLQPYAQIMKWERGYLEDYIFAYTTAPIVWHSTAITPFNLSTSPFHIDLDDRHSALIINQYADTGAEIYPKGATGTWTTRQDGSYHFECGITMGPLPDEDRALTVTSVSSPLISQEAIKIHGYWVKYGTDKIEPMWGPDEIEYPDYIEEIRKVGGGFITVNQEMDRGLYSYPDPDNLQFYLSGGASNSDPDDSLGGGISSTPVSYGLNALFNEVVANDILRGRSTYRCLYLRNISLTDTAVGLLVWAQGTLQGSFFAVGVDPVGVGGIATTIQSEYSVPVGVEFVETYGQASAVKMRVLDTEEYIPVWIRLTPDTNNTMKIDNENLQLMVGALNNGG